MESFSASSKESKTSLKPNRSPCSANSDTLFFAAVENWVKAYSLDWFVANPFP
jgi:hypothetical protein